METGLLARFPDRNAVNAERQWRHGMWDRSFLAVSGPERGERRKAMETIFEGASTSDKSGPERGERRKAMETRAGLSRIDPSSRPERGERRKAMETRAGLSRIDPSSRPERGERRKAMETFDTVRLLLWLS